MEEIAIVGLGCLFPEAQNPDQFWDNLLAMKDCTSDLRADDIGVDPKHYYHPKKGTPDKINYHRNGYVRGFEFDPTGYHISPNDLSSLDPLFHWTLYAAEQALEDMRGGVSKEERHKIGLVIGNISMPTLSGKKLFSNFYNCLIQPYIQRLIGDQRFQFKSYWDTDGLSDHNIFSASFNATIAAQALGIQGPSFAIDAACSSAIYVMQLASYYLQTGKADIMLAGSVCHADPIYINHGFNVLQAFPDKGESIPFDKESEGLKAGEGAGVIALKRVSDAIRDKDRIYSVIENIGLSNDAGAKHILVPDKEGQILSLERAYKDRSRDVDYIECHATGTPVGDTVELNSIEEFFYNHGQTPLLGANKGNIGHMLTASGMASIIKVLLSMTHNQIPGTMKISNLVATDAKKITKDSVVLKNQPWPQTDKPKRAGINAFGFGGVNGHMLLREHLPHRHSIPVMEKKFEDIVEETAIVGMSVAVGDILELEKFNDVIQQNKQNFKPLPKTRWSGFEKSRVIMEEFGLDSIPDGAYIEKFDFDCKRFKLPPNVAEIHLLAHMSLMQLAARAFYDAGYEIDGKKRNVAVIIAGEADFTCYRYQFRNEISWQIRESLERNGIELQEKDIEYLEEIVKDGIFPTPYAEGITGGIGNVVASRISAILKLNGPTFSLSSHENSVFKAVEVARFLLNLDDIEAVIVGSGSFGGGFENVLWGNKQHPINKGIKTLGYDKNSNGWNVGEGGGVVVLKRLDKAKQNNDRIYSTIKSIAIVQENGYGEIPLQPNSGAVAKVIRSSLDNAGLVAGQISFVEGNASGIDEQDCSELKGLTSAYRQHVQDNPIPVSSIKANVGHLSSASGILSMIKTALCLYHRYIPGTPHWSGPKYPELWADNILTVKQSSSPFTEAETDTPHYAAVNSLGADRSYAHLILASADRANHKAQRKVDREQLVQGALIKTIYVGREQGIEDIILSDENIQYFQERVKQQTPLQDYSSTPSSKVVQIISHQKPRSQENFPIRNARVAGGKVVTIDIAALQQKAYARNLETHLKYLQTENSFYRVLGNLVVRGAGGNSSDHNVVSHRLVERTTKPNRPKLPPPVFDEGQLIELTDGRISNVLGEEYAEADTYPIRTRMPSSPYLFVSRITKLTAKKGELKPCVVEWEYDIPEDAWFVSHGFAPAFVSLESSHAMIVAFTYIGCDQMFKGELSYRAIDSQTTIHGPLPKAGDILQGRVDIKSFIKVGKNVLVFYEYQCFVAGKLAFVLEANSGFFPKKEIEKAKGIDRSEIFSAAERYETSFESPLFCHKSSFSDEDLSTLQNGDLEACFGNGYGKAIYPALHADQTKMLDRVVQVDPRGGEWGLGVVIGERDIDPEHWAFKAHFKNDPVMPGTFLVEGCEQLLKFYLYYLGLHTQSHLVPALLKDHQYRARFRGEVKPQQTTLQYRLTCKKIDAICCEESKKITDISVVCVTEIVSEGNVIGVCDNLAARFIDSAINS